MFCDAVEDFVWVGSPDEGSWLPVVVLEVFVDLLFEVPDATKGATANTFRRDLGEESFDHIDPRRARRREVQMVVRALRKPALHARCLVGGIVVENQMNLEPISFGDA